MVARKTPSPVLPTAPHEYSQWYMDRLVSVIMMMSHDIRTPGNLRGVDLNLSNIPTSGVGLSEGDVFRNNLGQLFIVMENNGWTEGLQATGQVGSVTVTP